MVGRRDEQAPLLVWVAHSEGLQGTIRGVLVGVGDSVKVGEGVGVCVGVGVLVRVRVTVGVLERNGVLVKMAVRVYVGRGK